MKILLVNEGCVIGGIETWMINLSSFLRAHGHLCELFFFQHGPMEEYFPQDCVAHFGDVGDCMRLIKERHFDIVHVHSGDFDLGVSAFRNLGPKLVVTSHGWIIPGWNSTNCDAFAGSSKWLAEDQRTYSDMPIRHVMYGIDTAVFIPDATVPASSPPIVAWVGRGTAAVQKRIDKLAAVAPSLRRAGLRLWLAEASGPEAVEQAVPGAAPVLQPIADFWGGVPKDQMPRFFQEVAASGGCVLSTSSYEGLGLAFVEAQACGCPVIATDVRGINEAVDPARGGVLYPFEMEPEDVAKLVLETLQDTRGMARRREMCVEFAREQFSFERMAKEYISIYEDVLRPHAKATTRIGARLKRPRQWKNHILHGWTAGKTLYELSCKLAERGEWDLAAAAARTSLETCPTLYAKPHRLVHLLKMRRRPHAIS